MIQLNLQIVEEVLLTATSSQASSIKQSVVTHKQMNQPAVCNSLESGYIRQQQHEHHNDRD